MAETSDRHDSQPPDVNEADRALDTLFDDAGAEPDAGAETRLWNRVQSEMGPQSQPWYAPVTRLLGGSVLGLPARRVAMVGGLAGVMIAAVLVVPGLGGSSASAAILDAVDELSEATATALDDDDLDDAELQALRAQADELLRRIEDDPDAFDDLDLDDLSTAIVALQRVESLLIDRPTLGDDGEVGGQVGRVAQWVEAALEARDPDNVLLAATITDDDSIDLLDPDDGRRALVVADAGTAVIEVSDDSLHLVGLRPNAGWIVTRGEFDDDDIEVWFTHEDGRAIELELELDDDAFSAEINSFATDNARSSDDDDDDARGSDDDDDARDNDDDDDGRGNDDDARSDDDDGESDARGSDDDQDDARSDDDDDIDDVDDSDDDVDDSDDEDDEDDATEDSSDDDSSDSDDDD